MSLSRFKFPVVTTMVGLVLSVSVIPSSLADTSTPPSPSQQQEIGSSKATISGIGKLSPNALIAVCDATTTAGKNNPTMMEGSVTVRCTEPLPIEIYAYADYCTAAIFGQCWPWAWEKKVAYGLRSRTTTYLKAGPDYKFVGKNQLWRYGAEICITFTTGRQCTEEYKTVQF